MMSRAGFLGSSPAGSKKKILALGVLVAGMLAASVLVAPSPAHASTIFTVNIPGDTKDPNTSDGVCDVNLFDSRTQCTLRAAIEQANATTGADNINFDIPDDFGAGVKKINVGSTGNGALPLITDTVSIDGYTQPGSSPNILAKGTDAQIMIELNGSSAGSEGGLTINTPNSVVRGLAINHFSGSGIALFASASNSRIEGNFIGTDASGTLDLGNGSNGVSDVNSGNNTLGGTSPKARNLISGNDVDGISIDQTGPGNKVLGNLLGTKKDGLSPLGNGRNSVSIFQVSGSGVTVGDGTSQGANTIAFNGSQGVQIGGGTANRVVSNSIFSNTDLAINLGVDERTSNDLGDVDSGANGLQNFPVLSSAKTGKKGTAIKGTLNSTPGKTFTVQFFSNPSGTDEGTQFIGQKSVTTGSSGNVSFTFKTKKKVGKGQNITATATAQASRDTSEFSDPKTVTAP